MTVTFKFKRGTGSDPSASDMVVGEPVLRTDTAELFFKKDDNSVAKVSGGGGGPDFKYLDLRNAANNGAASYPGNDFTLVTSGTTTAISPAAANTLLVSYGGVIQKPNSATSTSGITGFIVDGSRFKTATNLAAAPDFILYQESGGIGEPSDGTVTEAKLHVSNNPTNGYFLSAQSGNAGGLTWAAVNTDLVGDTSPQLGGNLDVSGNSIVSSSNGNIVIDPDGTGNIVLQTTTGEQTQLNGSGGDVVFGGYFTNGICQWDYSQSQLEFWDGVKASFGSDEDLVISYDASAGRTEIISQDTVHLKCDYFQLISSSSSGRAIYLDESNSFLELGFDGGHDAHFKGDGVTFLHDVTINAQKDLRFADSDSSNYVALQAPATVSSNVTWTLPAADGSSGQVLSTNASGTLSWATVAAFPSGTKMIFQQTSAPTGWTKVTSSVDNRALRVVSGSAGSGGSAAFTSAFSSQSVSGSIANTTAGGSISTNNTTATGTVNNHTLGSAEMPSHRHIPGNRPIWDEAAGEYGTINNQGYVSYPGGRYNGSANYDLHYSNYTGSGNAHNHGFSGNAHSHSGSFSGSAHNHSFSGSAIDLAVQYIDVIIASKD